MEAPHLAHLRDSAQCASSPWVVFICSLSLLQAATISKRGCSVSCESYYRIIETDCGLGNTLNLSFLSELRWPVGGTVPLPGAKRGKVP